MKYLEGISKMKELPLISVIVPVYRVENYLDKCIGSITAQTYQNLEIILVDDGSPDNSGAICDAWAERDARIQVIHKKNGGAGDAKNTGLNSATGEWISLIDSDDYIEPHMYEHLYSLTGEDIDIAECVIGITDADDMPMEDGSVFTANAFSAEDAMLLHIQEKMFCQTPPNKLYRRSTVGDIRFPVGTLIDDEFWTYRVIGNARRLVHSSCCMYAYRQQQSSAMHKPFSIRRLEGLYAQQQRLEYLKENMPSLEYDGKVNLLFYCIYAMQMSLRCLSGAELESACSIIRNAVSDITPIKVSGKNSVKANAWLVLAQISLEGTCKLQNFLEKRKS